MCVCVCVCVYVYVSGELAELAMSHNYVAVPRRNHSIAYFDCIAAFVAPYQ